MIEVTVVDANTGQPISASISERREGGATVVTATANGYSPGSARVYGNSSVTIRLRPRFGVL